MLAQYTSPALLQPRLSGTRAEEAIAELSQLLAAAGRVENALAFAHAASDHDALVQSVFDQVAYAVARGHGARRLGFAVGLAPAGIRWGNRAVVRAIVLSAVPPDQAQNYLSLLLAFGQWFQKPSSLETLCQCATAEEMFALFRLVPVTGQEASVLANTQPAPASTQARLFGR
jgi:mannitol/fructose-specific phosphotransferase system IIA component (Ntr-type)